MNEPFVWQTVPPKNQRMDVARLDALRNGLAVRGTKSLLVVRRDKIVYEWYAPGHGPDKPHYTASLAKALVGGLSLALALNDGLLNVDDPAWIYIPAWRDDPLKSQITIRHLATHSSGIEDAELSQADRERALAEGKTLSDHHMALPGWKGAFWRKELDPFSIAIHDAPVIFPPGTDYAYSNPGMAALAYVITTALRSTPWSDVRILLKERVMDPIGVAESAWSIGYGQTYTVDGLNLVANWGGGSYTARAVARVGRLMLRRGDWEGRQLIDSAWVKRVLAYAKTPLPSRLDGDPRPGSGLGWWTNFDGVWPSLPRDAFAGAGAGNQILLVVPCRDLIVVRNGATIGDPEQGEGFWDGLEKYLFIPLMDAFLDRLPGDANTAPYPPSPVIKEIIWSPPSTIVREGFHGDNWPITWAEGDAPSDDSAPSTNGVQYTAYGDGYGFAPYLDKVLSLGFVKVIGSPSNFEGINIRSESGERVGHDITGAKASGMLMVEGVLYMLARNTGNSQLAWSVDGAQTWTWADWRFTTSFGCPTFLNFGRNYAGARDSYVYVYSHDADSAYEPADRMVLARVPKNHIRERGAYEFFVRLNNGSPVWSHDITERGAVFEHPGLCRRSGISYNAGLRRYLWWQQRAELDVDTRFNGGFAIYDAPEPWGPWTTAYFTLEWDCGPGEMGSFPAKWMSADGTTCYLAFSGNDCFSVRKATLIQVASE